ncbi:hypothetical protein VSU16_07145 [Cetobacterium somerae]|uniref:hypothetical protein n=1 Tax=Cetobacterium somerae TaxID=188913 RepID=UPI002E7BCE52|nr:hypothetical protein [Cetobacterium somerae]WVJ00587.1 hypothetical protein VSU16_07145 [Cetobacterium somerae]
MYINSKHLQILKVIKSNPNISISEIGKLFSLSSQYTKLHLETIYLELFKDSLLPKDSLLISKIYNALNSKNKLRQVQQFTKNQKIFYLLFKLVTNKHIKLLHISKDLNITKRNINNYFYKINNILSFFSIKLNISNKGVKITGNDFSIRRITLFVIFKFLIEKDFLPPLFRKEALSFFKIKKFSQLKKDIINLSIAIGSETSEYHYFTIFSFFYSFCDNDSLNSLNDVSLEKIFKYKPSRHTDYFFLKIVTFLKKSNFSTLPTKYLDSFFNIIDIFFYSKTQYSKTTNSLVKQIQPIFYKYLGNQVSSKKDFFTLLTPWIEYCHIKSLFFIEDSSFLNINLNDISNSNLFKMVKEIQKLVPNFTLYEAVFLWYKLYFNQHNIQTNILVYKNINSTIIPNIIDEIYKTHNIIIHHSINIRFMNHYLKTNKVDNIITIENLNIYNKNISIMNVSFPIPEYNKMV